MDVSPPTYRACLSNQSRGADNGRGLMSVARSGERNMRLHQFAHGIAAAMLMALPVSLASAQSPAEFYKGKNIELYIGYSVGGGYDLYARMLAKHMGRHIPGT